MKGRWPRVWRQLAAPSVFLLVALVSYRRVLLTPGIVGHTWDWGFPVFPEQIIDHVRRMFYAWNDALDLGIPWVAGAETPYWLFLSCVSFLGGERLVKLLLVAITTLAGVTSYRLGRRRLGFGRWASGVMALYYMLSPVFYSRVLAGHLPTALGYALLPAFVSAALVGVSGRARAWRTIGAGILLGILGIHPTPLLLGFGILVMIAVTESVGPPFSFRPLFRAAAVGTLALALNGMWLVPTAGIGIRTKEIPRGWGLSADLGTIDPGVELSMRRQFRASTSQPLVDAIRAMARQGFDTEFVYPRPREFPKLWSLITFVPPLLAFASVFFEVRQRTHVMFLVLACLGVVLTAGVHTQLGAVIGDRVLIHNAAVYSEFSNTTRFLGLTVLAYAALIGYTLQAFGQQNPSRFRVVLLNGCALGAIVLYTVPFTSGRIVERLLPGSQPLSLMVTRVNPEDRKVYEFLRSDPDDIRVSFLPSARLSYVGDTDLSYEWSTTFSPKPEFISGFNKDESVTKFLVTSMYLRSGQLNIARMLGLMSVKYVVLPRYERVEAYNDFGLPDIQPALRASVAAERDLVPVPAMSRLRSATVYQNDRPEKHIYATAPTVVSGDWGTIETLRRSYLPAFPAPAFVFSEDLTADQIATLFSMPASAAVIDANVAPSLITAGPDDLVLRPGALVDRSKSEPRVAWVNLAYGWNYDWHYAAAVNASAGIFTFSPSTTVFHVNVKNAGRRSVFVTAHYGPENEEVVLDLDGRRVGRVPTHRTRDDGFEWALVGEVEVAPGDHMITVGTKGTREAVMTIALLSDESVDRDAWQSQAKQISVLATRSGQPISIPAAHTYTVIAKPSPPAPPSTEPAHCQDDGRPPVVRLDRQALPLHPLAGAEVAFPNDALEGTADVPMRKGSVEATWDCRVSSLLIRSATPGAAVGNPRVAWSKLSPVRYTAAVKGAARPFVLVFGDTFNPGWQASIERSPVQHGTGWPSVVAPVTDPTKGRLLETHFRVNGFANAWYVDQTGDFQIVLDYQPQVATAIAVLVTATVWLLSLGCVAIGVIRERKARAHSHRDDHAVMDRYNQ